MLMKFDFVKGAGLNLVLGRSILNFVEEIVITNKNEKKIWRGTTR